MSATTFVREVDDEPSPPRNRRRIVLIVAAVTVVVAVLGTWLVAFSPAFGVRSVDVRGTHVLSADEVRAAAQIKHGTPLVRLDTSAVTRRVERLPEVASAQVSTSFPSTVVITVQERVPVAYLRTGGRVRLVDRTGADYREVAQVPQGLPKLVVPDGAQRHSTAAALASVAAALPQHVREEVTSIQALDPDSITLVLTHGRVVRWGSAERTADKARLLPELLRHHPNQVDLTDPDQPFTR